jgi:hypothetical protein
MIRCSTMTAYAASAGREADLQAALDALFNEQNGTEPGATSIPATFLRDDRRGVSVEQLA